MHVTSAKIWKQLLRLKHAAAPEALPDDNDITAAWWKLPTHLLPLLLNHREATPPAAEVTRLKSLSTSTTNVSNPPPCANACAYRVDIRYRCQALLAGGLTPAGVVCRGGVFNLPAFSQICSCQLRHQLSRHVVLLKTAAAAH